MAFSFQEQHPDFLLDSAFLPEMPAEMLLIPAASCFTCPFSSERNDLFGPGRDATESVRSSVVPKSSVENKRKSTADEDSLNTGKSKDIQESKKRARNGAKQTKKPKINQVKQGSKACNSDPTAGYIHVRAMRGQATDSHSLAERVRREKISERMKMLQGLVPGCEKVTGKALMLDEIINYVQSLQNQVEFLSMKIASLSPILYDFNLDFDDCIINPLQWQKFQKVMNPLPCLEQTKTSGAGAITNYQVMDEASAVLASFSQDGGSALQMDAQRQEFLDQLGFSNMCSFQ